MRIAIIGTGGVGGLYGGLLARSGQEVVFIARGAHLQAIQSRGLRVHGAGQDFCIQPARVSDSPAEVGPVDLILVCTKTYSTPEVLGSMRPLVAEHTSVISLQNGIEAADCLGEELGRQHILGGATWLSSVCESPGVIRQVSQFQRIVIGELDGSLTPRIQEIADAFKVTGITLEISNNIQKVLWTKFVFIAAISGVGALTRLELGDYRHVPETRALLEGSMREVESLGHACGIMFDEDIVQQTMEFIDRNDPQVKPSMQRDVERGARFELDALIGGVVRKGQSLSISTPVADMVYAALLPIYLKACQSHQAPRNNTTPGGHNGSAA